MVGFVDFGGFGNYNLTAITFEPIQGEIFTLADITVNDNYDTGSDFISIFEGGTKQFEATYLREGEGDYGEPAGWYLRACADDWEFPTEKCKSTYQLAKGKGIVFNRSTPDAAIKFAGQVQTESIEFKGFGNYNITANTTAVPLTLGDLRVNENYDTGSDFVSVFEGGTKQFEATYLREGEGDYGEPAGWYLRACADDWEFPTEKCKDSYKLPIGKGFVFNRSTPGAGIIIPAPLKADK